MFVIVLLSTLYGNCSGLMQFHNSMALKTMCVYSQFIRSCVGSFCTFVLKKYTCLYVKIDLPKYGPICGCMGQLC